MQEALRPASPASPTAPSTGFRLPASLPPYATVGLAVFCAVAALFLFPGTVRDLLNHWRSDDLQSVGLLIPFVCFGLILRAWRAIGWRADGSWWGLAVLAVIAGVMFLRDQTPLVITVHRDWLLQMPPLPLVTILYALGLVLLFGGARLLRAAAFPVLFMGAVLPVPNTFSRRVDLPLQHASATVARSFAHLLGEKLTPDNLRLMFTPDFGMFIAPGCNGIRGAVTLGLAAVIVAYLYRFRWYIFLPVVAGAVLLGYAFNFVRLCLLVVYYKIALPYPWLQDRAKGADYLIGGCLFIFALYLFFAVADRLRQSPNDSQKKFVTATPALLAQVETPAVPLLLRAAAVVSLSAVFGFDALHAQALAGAHPGATTGAIPPMPAELGGYHLVRTYQDTLVDGAVVYTWGEYVGPAPLGDPGGQRAPQIAVGVSPELDVHDTEVCHIARGEDPTSHGEILAPTTHGEAALVAATYNNGTTQTLEASTVCDNGTCRQFTSSTVGVTWIYAHPHRTLPMQAAASRPVPLLLKVESADAVSPASIVGPQLAGALKAFLRGVDLPALAARYSRTR